MNFPGNIIFREFQIKFPGKGKSPVMRLKRNALILFCRPASVDGKESEPGWLYASKCQNGSGFS